jgi:hypothetical protein
MRYALVPGRGLNELNCLFSGTISLVLNRHFLLNVVVLGDCDWVLILINLLANYIDEFLRDLRRI